MFVVANSMSEPGDVDLVKPQRKITITTPMVEVIPAKLTRLRMFRGRKEGGVNSKNAMTLK